MDTQADRQGKSAEMAEMFATSDLRRHADEELASQLKATSALPEEMRRELAVTRDTISPSLWQLR